VRFEVVVLQRVRGIDAAAIETRADQHQRLIEVGGELALVLARPVAGKVKRVGAHEHLLYLAAPAALHEFIRRGDGAPQEFLQLVALHLGRITEGAQKLARHRLGIHWWRFLALVGIFVDKLVDTDQRLPDRDSASLVDIDLAVVAGEILQRLAAPDHLNVGGGQTLLGVVFQHGLQLAYIGHHLATHPAPAHGLGLFCALAADVDDVVLDGLGAELAFALGLVGADRIRSFEVVASVE